MNINNAFPSKWIKSGDISEDQDLSLTIKKIEIETVGSGDDAEQKPIIYFEETEKGLVLNKTNADTIAKLHGPETDGWLGKRIALFATEVDYGGKQTLGIRVRMKAPKAIDSKPTRPRFENWNKAMEFANGAGLTADDVKNEFKTLGLAGFSPSRGDSEIIYSMADKAMQKAEEEAF